MHKNPKKTKLLFITQKMHQGDDDHAFVILWVKEFIRQGIDVKVICLEKWDFDDSFPVYSLGKERGKNRFLRALRFYKLIFTLDYDRVFVHMNPIYVTLGGWYWRLRGTPVYLWYTHYILNLHTWASNILCTRMFAATKQSLPQFDKGNKKVVTRGHGIDIEYWLSGYNKDGENDNSDHNLLAVHRICRSKRIELAIGALMHLPEEYNLTIYGRVFEKDYYKELLELIEKEGLGHRIFFKGPVPMRDLKEIYPNFRIMINMASETIDKTMLEGMLFGIYPVTTSGNSQAIGLPIYLDNDTPKEIAQFIMDRGWKKFDTAYLQNIVKTKHSLEGLVREMLEYIIKGI